MTNERCDKCRFWAVFPIDEKATFKRGTCRRMPPVIDLLCINEETIFYKENGKDQPDENAHCPTMWSQPSTWEDMWCGEFKPRKIVGASSPVAMETSP